VIRNHAVHPGELDLRDDRDTAVSLFGSSTSSLNSGSPSRRSQCVYSLLPESARKAIEGRDQH
jgi:hypothetical protein